MNIKGYIQFIKENIENRSAVNEWLVDELESWLSTYNHVDEDGENEDWDYVNEVIWRWNLGEETIEDCRDIAYYLMSSNGQEGDEDYEIYLDYCPNPDDYDIGKSDVNDFHREIEVLYNKLHE